MELGEKLRLARQEANLSQRQLCGEEITRNMLSQIEHGAAKPSMKTLRYLAARLGKPISYFLEEDAVLLPNKPVMEAARQAFDRGDYVLALEQLSAYQFPDAIFDREQQLLETLTLLALAEEAIADKKHPYAKELLSRAAATALEPPYPLLELERRRLLLLGQLPGEALPELCAELPSLDEELLLRAEAALKQENAARAEALLSAAENREAPRWNLLMGKVQLLQKRYPLAVEYLRRAEGQYPHTCWPLLEEAFRELGDFQQAYLYARRQI